MHRLQELVRLHRMGTGCRAAAALLGMSPNTERVYRQALIASSPWDGAVDASPLARNDPCLLARNDPPPACRSVMAG